MSTKTIDVYEVWTSVDEYGNKGTLVGIYGDKQSAWDASLNQGWYGGSGRIIATKALFHEGKWYLLALNGEPVNIIFDPETVVKER